MPWLRAAQRNTKERRGAEEAEEEGQNGPQKERGDRGARKRDFSQPPKRRISNFAADSLRFLFTRIVDGQCQKYIEAEY